MEEMLTVKDIQTIFKCGKTKAYEIVNMRGFPKIIIGHSIYVPKIKYEKWVSENIGNKIYL